MSVAPQTPAPRSLAVIADDHVIVRQGVKSILDRLPGVVLAGEASNGVELVALVKRVKPALAVCDIAMPHASGLEVVEEARRWSPETRFVLLTGLTSRGLIAQAETAPVAGIFLKSDLPAEIEAGLARILAGERVFSKAVAAILDEAAPAGALTGREIQVLHAIARGETNAVIAERLGVSANTVDKHRANMMRKLNVHSAAALLAVALREGLLDSARTL